MFNRWLTALLCLFTLSAHAQALRPNSGLWWEEPVTGRFYAVEIAPSGRAFVVVSEFDEQGQPVWRTLRGDLVVTSAQEQAAGAPLATLTAPLLDLDGACPTCPVSAPNARPSPLGSATIVFASEDRAEFQQGALRRPLRYFTPADQPADFPSARLRGDYVFTARTESGLSAFGTTLQPSQNGACTRYVGNEPAAGATWLRSNCQGGICEGSPGGALISNLELAVGPGEHPDILAYKRALAPEASIPPTCTLVFLTTTCTCPPGYSSTGTIQGIAQGCVRDDRPTVCTETHRISEQAGVLRGLPVTPVGVSFVLYPVAR